MGFINQLITGGPHIPLPHLFPASWRLLLWLRAAFFGTIRRRLPRSRDSRFFDTINDNQWESWVIPWVNINGLVWVTVIWVGYTMGYIMVNYMKRHWPLTWHCSFPASLWHRFSLSVELWAHPEPGFFASTFRRHLLELKQDNISHFYMIWTCSKNICNCL